MIKYLLDTNIVIFAIKKRPQSIPPKFNKNTDHMAISTITLAELIFLGLKKVEILREIWQLLVESALYN
ncbi:MULTISPECIES: hypothetical protein [Photorhabdus]|uniref:hypothetical protein n=1 Tax=Photorhabdus TaxID=29487 RepID=UPI000DCCEFE5|nr:MULTISPECIES: hypothetical protein [Photorhabdus]RAX10454.1 hypothetical protein CKY10_07825 [Photorhabdus sp. HUG-39]